MIPIINCALRDSALVEMAAARTYAIHCERLAAQYPRWADRALESREELAQAQRAAWMHGAPAAALEV